MLFPVLIGIQGFQCLKTSFERGQLQLQVTETHIEVEFVCSSTDIPPEATYPITVLLQTINPFLIMITVLRYSKYKLF